MGHHLLHLTSFLLVVVFIFGCDKGDPVSAERVPLRVEQGVKVYFKYGFRNEVDTFKGTYTKDLVVDGTITVSFSFSAAEQDSILQAMAQSEFYSMPDTLYPIPGLLIFPNAGPQILRVEYQGAIKSVVWFYLLDQTDPRNEAALNLFQRIRQLVESTEIYSRLPPAVGGYI